jgi:hypothetical protein
MPIVEGITAAKAAFDVSKQVVDLFKHPAIDADKIRSRLLELQELILSAQSALGEAQEENRTLRSQLDDQTRLLEFGKQFTFSEGVYWYRDYPYCPNCWDVDQKPMRLDGPFWHSFVGQGKRSFECNIHKSHYQVKERPAWK